MSYDLGARPEAGEYGDFHAGYIAAVPEGDIRETLARESAAACAFFGAVSVEQASLAYAPGKGTIREVLAHIADGERVFATENATYAQFAKTRLGHLPTFEKAGPKERIFHDPSWTRVGIVGLILEQILLFLAKQLHTEA